MTNDLFEQAAKLIASADGLLITAGAGMGVDSGLPDFRGQEGFWKAYPALAEARVSFTAIANPYAFFKNPKQAWGFYGHRLALYRKTVPHAGFHTLKSIANNLPNGAFVITSNVDGQFQKAGFAESKMYEIHGSIHHLQCTQPCRESVWSGDLINPTTDDSRCEWIGNHLPICDRCKKLARPNILMFDDGVWIDNRARVQQSAWLNWADQASNIVVIEIGAGVGIPSIRRISKAQGCPVIRINPRDFSLQEGAGVSLPIGAKEALQKISLALSELGFLNSPVKEERKADEK